MKTILKCPTQGSDLNPNPAEHLWDELERRSPRFTSVPDLTYVTECTRKIKWKFFSEAWRLFLQQRGNKMFNKQI